MLTRKERWGLSWHGRLLLALVVLLVSGSLLVSIYSFLAITHRVDTKVLVVEGWVHDYAIAAGVKEFKAGHYPRVYATGEGDGKWRLHDGLRHVSPRVWRAIEEGWNPRGIRADGSFARDGPGRIIRRLPCATGSANKT